MYTILVVDDNPSIVDIFTNMLIQGGYNVLSATNGEDALKIIENKRPDMILLDIMMEPMDGWETLERIKAGPPAISSIPVMMLTAKPLSPEDARAFGLSIEDYINKPITRRALYSSIDRFFHQRDRMETRMQIAGESGADPELIREYRTLCRTTDVEKRLLRILEHVASDNPHELGKVNSISSVIQTMKVELATKNERLEVVKGEFTRLGIAWEKL